MAYVSQVRYEEATPEQKKEFHDQIEKHGRITNMKKTLLHHVPSFKVLMGWYTLQEDVVKIVGERATNFYCYAISTQNDCLICSMFFRKILVDLGIDFETFEFTQEEQDLIEYGRGLVSNPESISSELFEKLKSRYGEEGLVLLTTFGAMMIATNLINTSLKVELDDVLVPYTKK